MAKNLHSLSSVLASKSEKDEKLGQMQDSLEAMDIEAPKKTHVRAYFTGEYYGGSQIWQCVQ